ncbi:MAG: hypothetical protein ACI9VR_001481 [Cognaticolwellia sp.]|jgi:hypothetical protein
MRSSLTKTGITFTGLLLLQVAAPHAADAADTLGLSAVAASLDDQGAAQASIIRRSKVRKKRTTGYRVIVKTSGDDSSSVAAVELGEDQPMELRSSRFEMSTAVDDYSVDSFFDVSFRVIITVVDDSVEDFTADDFIFSVVPGEWTTTTLSGTLSIKARVVFNEGDTSATLEAVLIAKDGAELDSLRAVDPTIKFTGSYYSATDGEALTLDVALTQDQVRSRWRYDLADSDIADGGLTLDVTAYDSDGVSVDTLTEWVSAEDVGSSDGINQIKLKERKNGSYRIKTVTSDSMGEDGELSVSVSDAEGAVLYETLDTEPASVERHFLIEGAYGDGFLEEDAAYYIQIDALDAEGLPVGSQVEVDLVVVPGTGSATNWIEDLDPTDGLEIGMIELVYDADTDTHSWLVAVTGEAVTTVSSIALSIETLEGGDAPDELPTLEMVTEWRQWTQTFTTESAISDDAAVNIDITLTDSDGEILDVIDAETGTGTVYASFGKGTKSSTSQASAKPQLL